MKNWLPIIIGFIFSSWVSFVFFARTFNGFYNETFEDFLFKCLVAVTFFGLILGAVGKIEIKALLGFSLLPFLGLSFFGLMGSLELLKDSNGDKFNQNLFRGFFSPLLLACAFAGFIILGSYFAKKAFRK